MLTRGGQLPLLLSAEVARQEEEKMGMRRGSTSLTQLLSVGGIAVGLPGAVVICEVFLLWAAVLLVIFLFFPTCMAAQICLPVRLLPYSWMLLSLGFHVFVSTIGCFLCFGLSALLIHCICRLQIPIGVPCLPGLGTCPHPSLSQA